MGLDLGVFGVVFRFLNPADVLSMSLTCSTIRLVAIKRLVGMYPVALKDTEFICRFHTFVFSNTSSQLLQHIRALVIDINPQDHKEKHMSSEVVQWLLDLLSQAANLQSLGINCPSLKFAENDQILDTIKNMTTLKELHIQGGQRANMLEDIVQGSQSPLEVLHAGLSYETCVDNAFIDKLLAQYATTLRILNIQVWKSHFIEKTLQYPAIRSISLSNLAGFPSMDVLLHMFPALDDTLDIGTLDETLRVIENEAHH